MRKVKKGDICILSTLIEPGSFIVCSSGTDNVSSMYNKNRTSDPIMRVNNDTLLFLYRKGLVRQEGSLILPTAAAAAFVDDYIKNKK